ncbi:MAG: hypothetical protein NT067_00510 [Candidatus Diapherotrites archaeon]|nr:hypothetical protein [Candidatus Diapherotrites archaeon]
MPEGNAMMRLAELVIASTLGAVLGVFLSAGTPLDFNFFMKVLVVDCVLAVIFFILTKVTMPKIGGKAPALTRPYRERGNPRDEGYEENYPEEELPPEEELLPEEGQEPYPEAEWEEEKPQKQPAKGRTFGPKKARK